MRRFSVPHLVMTLLLTLCLCAGLLPATVVTLGALADQWATMTDYEQRSDVRLPLFVAPVEETAP